MMRSTTTLGVAAATAVALVLGACSLMEPAQKKTPAVPVEAPLPEDAAPVATHRFEIDAERDDIVGVLQVTRTSKEDTLSDVARRFNVGYEEIVRANPGVDPWLPGEREIVVPTRHI